MPPLASTTIKVGIVSDLHSEFWSPSYADQIGGLLHERLVDADFILLAGDIGVGTNSITTAQTLFPDQPIFMVAGNHEFYQHDYEALLSDLQASDHFLHNSVAEITIRDVPVRILGTTLWTDFNLHRTPDLSLFHARRSLNDFRMIRYGDHLLTPEDTLALYREQRAWIMATLDQNFDGITILMTHHAPVSFAIGPKYVGDALSPCFASDMELALVRDDLPLVVWGHTHHCVDRTIDGTRFVSNQTGYPAGNPVTETGQFGQVVELSRTN